MFLGVYNIPTAVSFLALIFGMASCIFSFNGYIGYALVCLIWAGISDLFDGFIARRFDLNEQEKAFGAEIDSINDIVNFGAAPAMIALHSGFNSPVDHILLTAYCCAAAMRLGHFNISGLIGEGPVKFYTGLPVTFSAMIFPLVFSVKFMLSGPSYIWTVRASYAAVGVLFLLKVPFPKPKGIFYVIFPALAVIVSVFWIMKPAG
ncbi:MAG TPA: CDP-alcohol phosphatidyltransferase family protein [Desulfomonilia bacterium]